MPLRRIAGLDVPRLLEAERLHVALVTGGDRFEEMAHVVADVEAGEHAAARRCTASTGAVAAMRKVRFFTDRHTRNRGGWIEAMRGEAHQAAVALARGSSSDDVHRVLELADEGMKAAAVRHQAARRDAGGGP